MTVSPSLARARQVLLAVALALVLLAPAQARASDASLKATLAKWSHRIQSDARRIGLSATRRHPLRMTSRARAFRLDAVRAQRALTPQKPSTARGRKAKSLALAAFRDYAIVGREWALSGEARVRRDKAAAAKHARLASRYAKKGNGLLVGAGKLFR